MLSGRNADHFTFERGQIARPSFRITPARYIPELLVLESNISNSINRNSEGWISRRVGFVRGEARNLSTCRRLHRTISTINSHNCICCSREILSIKHDCFSAKYRTKSRNYRVEFWGNCTIVGNLTCRISHAVKV